MKDLAGRIALVTGGAVRIGRTLALALAGAGADVVIHYRNSTAAARETVAEIEKLGSRGARVQADLGEAGAGERVVAEAAKALGAVDILINNAAIFESGSVCEMTFDQWERMQAINVRAPLELSLALAAGLPTGSPGDIINLSDSQVQHARPGFFAYTASKLMLHGMTSNLARELAPGIRVNEIALGPVLSPAIPPESYIPTKKSDVPLRVFPTPGDVAATMLFLLRTQCLTGVSIPVDSGRHLNS